MTIKFPIKIHRLEQNGTVRFKVATNLEKAQQDLLRTKRQLSWAETDYQLTVLAAKASLQQATRSFRRDPRAYWHMAFILDGFLRRLGNAGYYLPHFSTMFARDIGFSSSSMGKILLFFKRFPDPSELDPAVPWKRYRDNMIPRSADSRKQAVDPVRRRASLS